MPPKLIFRASELEGENSSQKNFDRNLKTKNEGIFSRLGTGVSNIWGATTKRFDTMADIAKRTASGEQGPASTIAQTFGQAAGLVGDVVGEGLQTVGSVALKAATSDKQETKIREAGREKMGQILNTGAGKAAANLLSRFEELKKTDPVKAANIEAALNITDFALNFIGAGEVAKGAELTSKAVKTGLKEGGELITKSGIGQAVKPLAENIVGATKEGLETTKTALGRGFNRGAKLIEEKAAVAALPEAEKEATRILPQEIVTRVKTSNPETKKAILNITKAAERRSLDPSSMERPIEVIGQKLVDKAALISKSLKETGAKLGEIKKTLRGKEIPMIGKIDEGTMGVADELINDMDRLGIEFSKDGLKAVEGAPVNDDVLEILNEVYKYAGSKPAITAENADRLRKTLFKSFSKSGVPLQNEAQGLATKYRDILAKAIGKVSQEYGVESAKYSTKHKALEDFVKLLGYKGDMESITERGLRAGEVANRVLGNASDRPKEVIDALIQEAKNSGDLSKDQIYDLIKFADELEGVLGTTQTRSLQGQVERAGESLLSRVPVIGGVLEGVAGLGKAGPEEKIKAILELLKSK